MYPGGWRPVGPPVGEGERETVLHREVARLLGPLLGPGPRPGRPLGAQLKRHPVTGRETGDFLYYVVTSEMWLYSEKYI